MRFWVKEKKKRKKGPGLKEKERKKKVQPKWAFSSPATQRRLSPINLI